MTELEHDEIEYIVENTLFSEREAQVHRLKEKGMSRKEIADKFDLNKNTIDEYNRRIREKTADAKRTLKIRSNIDNTEDFKEYLESSYDNIEFDDRSKYIDAHIITDGLNWYQSQPIRSRSVKFCSLKQKDGKIEIKVRYFKNN